ncbi:MAG: hypothetical protein IKZ08_01850, partial [Bacteroidales bacterium]|nr:hypothetical protein [Bacteroidales bacterium]
GWTSFILTKELTTLNKAQTLKNKYNFKIKEQSVYRPTRVGSRCPSGLSQSDWGLDIFHLDERIDDLKQSTNVKKQV